MAIKYFRPSTLMAAALKEARLAGHQTQGMVAVKSGKTQNAYCKIENGYTELSMDAFLAICQALSIMPSHALHQIEIHTLWLCNQGWRMATLKSQECELAPFFEMYFMVENSEALNRVMCLEQDRVKLIGGWQANYYIPAILRLATEPKFRQAVDAFKAQFQ